MEAPHMTPDEFRTQARAVVDWVADYWTNVGSFPVSATTAPGEIFHALPQTPPTTGQSVDEMLRDLTTTILPGITHWQHPSFFGFFPCNTSGPAVLADIVSSGLGVNGMNWATSPAATEVELLMLDWFVELLGLPNQFKNSHEGSGGGVLQDSASSATLCTMLAARKRKTDGGDLSHLVAYTSEHAHSSILKSARVAGLHDSQVRMIPTDSTYAMRPDALANAIEQDKADGKTPFFCCATIGTTSSMAFDPVSQIAAITQANDIWLHVDAAMAGTAAVCPELRWVLDGADQADSWSFNPHKWLFTTFDCTCLWLADRHSLIDALSITPAYLRNDASDAGEVVDYRDWQIPLGRRFRALKPWFVLRHYGSDALADAIRAHIGLARNFADWVLGQDRIEFAAPPALNLVCFRVRGDDVATTTLARAINDSGQAMLTPTVLDDRPAIRVCIGQTSTTATHVEALQQQIADLLAG